MNIKSRLSKIEDKLNFNSAMCNCPHDIVFKVFPYGERTEEPKQQICDDCRKPIPTHPPFTFNFNNNIETNVILPTTNYTREEFEQWQNEHVLSKHQTYEEYLAEQVNEY